MKHLSRGTHISIRDDTQIHRHIVLGIVNSEKLLFCWKIFIHISRVLYQGSVPFSFREVFVYIRGQRPLSASQEWR